MYKLLDTVVQIVKPPYVANFMRDRIETFRLPPGARGQCAKHLSILDAAAAVFCREGYAGASIDLIAAEAGVSRQTIYNHHGDKEHLFVAVVKDMTDCSNAALFRTLATFPDRPQDLEKRAHRLRRAARQGLHLQSRGGGAPQADPGRGRALSRAVRGLARAWSGQPWTAIAARFAKLAHAGLLQIEDPDLAARQFLALVSADTQMTSLLGGTPTEAEIRSAVTNAVGTFLRAFGPNSVKPASDRA